RANSMLTFEGNPILGVQGIVEKLATLPFQRVSHKIVTLDAQPNKDGIVISVTGQLLVDDSPNALFFTQTFVLHPEGGSYYVNNDIFRFVSA
ncbi:Nuclear transport factor 2, partial [Mortierella sp. AM989]